MKKLHVSDALSLPVDTVTSTLVVYGGKGMGKTNFASVLVEEIAANGLRFAFLDPVGVSWGLRHSLDGKGPGIELLILGGIHGDIPIEPTGGAVVADLVVDESVNVLIDVSRRPDGSMWSIGERIRFVADYCKRLYQRQGEKRRPIMQVIDEAARFAPQMVRKNEDNIAACMGAIAVLVEEGRNVGIGVTLLTLRSARLNKDVAELADCMIAFRTVGPNSREAVMDWLGAYVAKDRLKELDATVRTLPVGSALVVSPGWLEFEGVVAFRARRTFDSSKTPRPGEQVRASGPGAKPDLAKYSERMHETIERAKDNDPKELKKQLADAKREIAKLKDSSSQAKAPTDEREIQRRIKVAVDEETRNLKQQVAARDARIAELASVAKENLLHIVKELGVKFSPGPAPKRDSSKPLLSIDHGPFKEVTADQAARAIAASRLPQTQRSTVTIERRAARDDNGRAAVPGGSIRKILIALAQHPDGLDYRHIGAFAGVSTKGGSFASWLSTCRTNGWIVGNNEQGVRITADGLHALGEYEPLPTGRDLASYWIRQVGGTPGRILELLVEQYPANLSYDEIGNALGISTKGGSFASWLSILRTRDLIDGGAGTGVRAAEMFFQ